MSIRLVLEVSFVFNLKELFIKVVKNTKQFINGNLN